VIGAAVDCPSWKTSIGIAVTLSLRSGVNTVGSFGFFKGDFLGVGLDVALGVVGSGVDSAFAFCKTVNVAQSYTAGRGRTLLALGAMSMERLRPVASQWQVLQI
jgi:hypothetical protein